MRLLSMLLVFAFALLAAICALYTSTAFQLLRLHPLALDVVDGRMTESDLKTFTRNGVAFTAREIGHLLDVKGAVAAARTGLLTLAAALAVVLGLRRDLIRAAAGGALTLFLGALAALAAALLAFGPAATFDALHSVVFEPGTYVFDIRSLTAQLYGNPLVLRGLGFVLGLAFVLLLGLWAAARLLSRRGLLKTG